jgi:hypothetical protein
LLFHIKDKSPKHERQDPVTQNLHGSHIRENKSTDTLWYM